MRIRRLSHFGAGIPLSIGALLALTTACNEPGGDDPDPTGADVTGGVDPETGGGPGEEAVDPDSEEGDDPSEEGPEEGGDVDCGIEETYIEGLFNDNCGGCHGTAAVQNDNVRVPGYDYVADIATLVGSGKIVMGDTEASPLFGLIADGTMPLDGEPLAQADVDRVAAFINSCEVEGVEPGDNGFEDDCEPNPFLSDTDILELMVDDIQSNDVDEDDREFTRYLSCAHLSNQGVCGLEMTAYEDALNKLVNSTSVDATATRIVPVEGSFGSIFRINLEDYGYDEPVIADAFDKDVDLVNDDVLFNLQVAVAFNDKWELISRGSPYGFTCDLGEQDCADLVEDAVDFIPFLECDAFIEIASRSDDSDFASGIYYDLAEVPADLDDLEVLLNFNFDQFLIDEEVIRAGVGNSIATRNELLVQYLQSDNGDHVFTRCDFDGNEVGEDLRNNPIDILDECDNQALMYSLPNDMFAYMMVDANGIRIDEILAEDFGDPRLGLDKGGNNIASNSCNGCHGGQILRPAEDFVLGVYQDGDGNDDINEDDVEAIYAELDDFQELLDDTASEYLNVLDDIVSNTNRDTIQTLYLEFRDDVDSIVAASEFLIAEGQLDNNLADCSDTLEALGTGGTVSRDNFERLSSECRCEIGTADPDFCDDVFGGADQASVDNDELNFAAILDAAL